MKKTLVVLAILAAAAVMLSFSFRQEDPWKVPEKYEKMKNPVGSSPSSIKEGHVLYDEHCAECHGKNGKGDGIRAKSLSNAPSDFTSAKFQAQSDGSLLYKIYFGHRDMPGFKNRIPGNEDVMDGTFGQTRTPGDLINYLRTFSTK
jgi:cytochrome c553